MTDITQIFKYNAGGLGAHSAGANGGIAGALAQGLGQIAKTGIALHQQAEGEQIKRDMRMNEAATWIRTTGNMRYNIEGMFNQFGDDMEGIEKNAGKMRDKIVGMQPTAEKKEKAAKYFDDIYHPMRTKKMGEMAKKAKNRNSLEIFAALTDKKDAMNKAMQAGDEKLLQNLFTEYNILESVVVDANILSPEKSISDRQNLLKNLVFSKTGKDFNDYRAKGGDVFTFFDHIGKGKIAPELNNTERQNLIEYLKDSLESEQFAEDYQNSEYEKNRQAQTNQIIGAIFSDGLLDSPDGIMHAQQNIYSMVKNGDISQEQGRDIIQTINANEYSFLRDKGVYERLKREIEYGDGFSIEKLYEARERGLLSSTENNELLNLWEARQIAHRPDIKEHLSILDLQVSRNFGIVTIANEHDLLSTKQAAKMYFLNALRAFEKTGATLTPDIINAITQKTLGHFTPQQENTQPAATAPLNSNTHKNRKGALEELEKRKTEQQLRHEFNND